MMADRRGFFCFEKAPSGTWRNYGVTFKFSSFSDK